MGGGWEGRDVIGFSGGGLGGWWEGGGCKVGL